MSQHSATDSRSPSPVVVSKALPYEALQYTSSITSIDQISTILGKHGLMISTDLVVRVPQPDERSCHAPRGSNKLQLASWSQETLRTGALLPLKPYFKIILTHVKIAPFQLQTNAYRILAALKSLYKLQGWGESTLEDIFYLFTLKKNPPGAHGGDGFYYLAPWPQEKRIFEDVPNKPSNFKKQFSGTVHFLSASIIPSTEVVSISTSW